jgi:WhiB family redox-sensing transcriptional regulator
VTAGVPVFRRVFPRGDLSWEDGALCAQVDPELFFPEKGASPADAKSVCLACEVRVPCLGRAVETGDVHGVRGGFTAYERRAVTRRHRAGASLEDIIAEAAAYGRIERAA